MSSRRKGPVKMPKEFTVVELERVLRNRRLILERKIKERNRLRKALWHLEREIVAVGGPNGIPRKVRRRPKNSKTLVVAVTDALARHKKGLSLRDLANEVLASGYKTSSTNFHNTLYQSLYHNSDKLFHDAKTHTYRLK